MLGAFPLWLQVPIALIIAGGVITLWTMSLRGLWRQEQVRKAAGADVSSVSPGLPQRSTKRSRSDLAILIGAGVAIVVLAAVGSVGNADLRQWSMGAIVVAAGVQQWQSRRRAKREADAQQYPPYHPYQRH